MADQYKGHGAQSNPPPRVPRQRSQRRRVARPLYAGIRIPACAHAQEARRREDLSEWGARGGFGAIFLSRQAERGEGDAGRAWKIEGECDQPGVNRFPEFSGNLKRNLARESAAGLEMDCTRGETPRSLSRLRAEGMWAGRG